MGCINMMEDKKDVDGMWHVQAAKFKHVSEQPELQFKCAYPIGQQ